MSLFHYLFWGTLSTFSISLACDSELEKAKNTPSKLDYSNRQIMDDNLIKSLPNFEGCLLSTTVQEILNTNDNAPIKELKLNNNIIAEWGAEYLAKNLYPQLQQLTLLDLSDNWITEDALKHAAYLLQTSHFKYLIITGNKGATLHGINNLRNELSAIKTFHTPDYLLKKVIWVKEEDIDSYADAYLLQWKHAQAHHRYYQKLKGHKNLVIRDLSAPEVNKAIVPEILKDLKSDIYNDEKFTSLALKALEDSESAYLIGREYYSGTKLKRNYTKAAEWFTFAAKKDHIKAIEDLAVLYRNGFLPVTKDLLAESKAFMTRATERGAKLSVSYID